MFSGFGQNIKNVAYLRCTFFSSKEIVITTMAAEHFVQHPDDIKKGENLQEFP